MCDSLATKIERKMHLRDCKAKSCENEINIRFFLSLKLSHKLLFSRRNFFLLIFIAAAAGRYCRHRLRTQSHVIMMKTQSRPTHVLCSHCSACLCVRELCDIYGKRNTRNGNAVVFRWFETDTQSYRLWPRPCHRFINFKWQNDCIRFASSASIERPINNKNVII